MTSQPATSILPEEELARSGVYALLGALLTAPCSAALRDFIVSIDDEGGRARSALSWKNLKDEISEADLTETAQDYHDLFIGLGRGELLPYGSVYLSGFLQEKPLAELRIDLGRLGFEAREDTHEPEDHAGALCEVMSTIVGAPNEFSYDTQSDFFAQHMGSWMTEFFDDLIKARESGFYRVVGEFGKAFIEIEKQYFDMEI